MRIVQLYTQARGGPVDHAFDVATELARQGHESHVVGPHTPRHAALAAAGVRTHLAQMPRKCDVLGAGRLGRTLRALRPDVVHCQDRRAGLVGRLWGQTTNLATVYTLHGVPDPLAHLVPGNAAVAALTRRDRVGNLTGERLLGGVRRSLTVTPCEALTTYARTHIGLPTDRVHTVHNGVGRSWLAPATSSTSTGTDPNPTAVWVGVMQPVKRLPALVRAVAEVPDLQLVLVGDGPERARVEETVRAAGVTDRVRLVGFQPDPRPWLDAADLIVLPSAAEACPMALLQGMARGLPVVASHAGGIPELVRDGREGLLVPTGAHAALRDALTRMAGDPALRTRMGARARTRVEESFAVEHCVRRLVDVYAEVAS